MTAPLSSPEPADAHPSVEELADLAEGLVEPAGAAEALHRHLDGCAECRGTADALTEVQALLGAVEPEPVPADVAARLDAALAEAALADRSAARSAQRPPERPRQASATTGRTGAPATPVRAVPAPSAPPPRPAASSGPGRPRLRRRRFAVLLGAAAALAAFGLGGALLLDHSGDSGTSAASAAATGVAQDQSARTPHLSGPGTVYREDRLAAQVQQLLARSGTEPGLRASEPAKSGAAPAEGVRPELSGPTSPAAPASPTACPAPAPGAPLATDQGSYLGAPVEVLVYPSPGRPGFVDVYLRSPDCGPVVLHQTVPGH
ncbi:hypothetical protein [Kitasatospora sp. NPDC001683]